MSNYSDREKGFLAGDILSLADGFHNLKMQTTPNLTSTSIEWLLKDDKQMGGVLNQCIDRINNSRKGNRVLLERVS